MLFLIAPLSALAGQELSLNSGVTYIEGNDAGGHIQIGYQYGFTKNLGIYTGYAYGHASLTGDTALIISDGYAHPENITYHTIPLALQATLPLGIIHSIFEQALTFIMKIILLRVKTDLAFMAPLGGNIILVMSNIGISAYLINV